MHKPWPKLFVVGAPRSGTSWVQNVLLGHPETVGHVGESHLVTELLQALTGTPHPMSRRVAARKWLVSHSAAIGWSSMLARSVQVWRDRAERPRFLRALSVPRLAALAVQAMARGGAPEAQAMWAAQQAFDRYADAHRTPRSTVFIEKTPGHAMHAEAILAAWPEAKVVEILRDPRDAALSLDRNQASWAVTRDWQSAIGQWRRALTCVAAARQRFPDRVLRVRFEALVADPVDGFTRLCAFAGLDADEATVVEAIAAAAGKRIGQRTPVSKAYRRAAPGVGREELPTEALAAIHTQLGELAAANGYDLST